MLHAYTNNLHTHSLLANCSLIVGRPCQRSCQMCQEAVSKLLGSNSFGHKSYHALAVIPESACRPALGISGATVLACACA